MLHSRLLNGFWHTLTLLAIITQTSAARIEYPWIQPKQTGGNRRVALLPRGRIHPGWPGGWKSRGMARAMKALPPQNPEKQGILVCEATPAI